MRDWLLRGLGLLLLVLVGTWLALVTEWVEEKTHIPATGEAATNPLYAAQALARDLGASVTQQTSLRILPPQGATLVLTSDDWDLFPGRDQALHDWVQQGGHLVIPTKLLDNLDWLPVRTVKLKTAETCHPDTQYKRTETNPDAQDETAKVQSDAQSKTTETDSDNADKSTEAQPDTQGKPTETQSDAQDKTTETQSDAQSKTTETDDEDPGCRHLTETGLDAGAGFRLCWPPDSLALKSGADGLWSAHDANGNDALLRAAFGQGSVTVIGPWPAMMEERILEAEHAQAFVAALRLRSGMSLWFIAEESSASLLTWLWQQAWVALLLGLLALGVALWRGAARFGPRQALPCVERRSMAEQIVGTAHFLARSDAQALHQAQIRALDEVAAPRLRRYADLDANTRARLIAALTDLHADTLAQAMLAGTRNSARLDADLVYLETAARRLRAISANAATNVVVSSIHPST